MSKGEARTLAEYLERERDRMHAEWDRQTRRIERVKDLLDRAEAAPNPYADQGAVAQVDVRDVRAALADD